MKTFNLFGGSNIRFIQFGFIGMMFTENFIIAPDKVALFSAKTY